MLVRPLTLRVFALHDTKKGAERWDTGARSDSVYFDSVQTIVSAAELCAGAVIRPYPVQVKSGTTLPTQEVSLYCYRRWTWGASQSPTCDVCMVR